MRCSSFIRLAGRSFVFTSILAGLSTAPNARSADAAAGALAEYVTHPDNSFTWKELEHRQVQGVSAFRLECTSQTWHEHPWRHQILVVRPPEIRNPDIAFLFVTGDDNIEKRFELLRTIALRGGAITAMINHIPN